MEITIRVIPFLIGFIGAKVIFYLIDKRERKKEKELMNIKKDWNKL